MPLKHLYNTDLGENVDRLLEEVKKRDNSIFVDLGVRSGVSSEILLFDSIGKNNRVYGVDVDLGGINRNVLNHERYEAIRGDSVTVGKRWDKGGISGLFVDTFHIKEQVMCELKYWFPLVEVGGFVAFHDSNWPKGKRDVYGGVEYGRVEEGIKSFFGVEDLDYEDDYISMKNYPKSWGMTIVNVKRSKDYGSEIDSWGEIFSTRNALIANFWNKNNVGDLVIDLEIN